MYKKVGTEIQFSHISLNSSDKHVIALDHLAGRKARPVRRTKELLCKIQYVACTREKLLRKSWVMLKAKSLNLSSTLTVHLMICVKIQIANYPFGKKNTFLSCMINSTILEQQITLLGRI